MRSLIFLVAIISTVTSVIPDTCAALPSALVRTYSAFFFLYYSIMIADPICGRHRRSEGPRLHAGIRSARVCRPEDPNSHEYCRSCSVVRVSGRNYFTLRYFQIEKWFDCSARQTFYNTMGRSYEVCINRYNIFQMVTLLFISNVHILFSGRFHHQQCACARPSLPTAAVHVLRWIRQYEHLFTFHFPGNSKGWNELFQSGWPIVTA